MSTVPIVEKKKRGRKKGFKVKKKNSQAQPAVRADSVVPLHPSATENVPRLVIDERNPLMQVMAEEWERLEGIIEDARSRQAYLKELVEKAKAS